MGLFQFDLVAAIFGGQDSVLSRLVHILVGPSAVILLVTPDTWARREHVTR